MANCVNRNSKEFQELLSEVNDTPPVKEGVSNLFESNQEVETKHINPTALAAKVSLWQDKNGLDKFPTKEDLNLSSMSLENTTNNSIEEDIDFLPFSSVEEKEDTVRFLNELESPEDIEEAKGEVLQRIPELLSSIPEGNLQISNDSNGNPRKIVVSPSKGGVAKIRQSALDAASKINKVLGTTFGKVARIVNISNSGATISLEVPKMMAQATLLGMEKEGKKAYLTEVYNRKRESENLPRIEFVRDDIDSHLDFLKEQAHAKFSGFFHPETGELITDAKEYSNYLKGVEENIKELEEFEKRDLEKQFENIDFDDDFSLSSLNPITGFLDPNYSAYKAKREEQLARTQTIIERLKSKKKKSKESVPDIDKRLVEMYGLAQSLKEDIDNFDRSLDTFQTVVDLFEKDMKLISDLISNPNLENIFIAKDIFDFLQYNSTPKHLKNVMFSKLNNKGVPFPANVEKYLSDLREEVIKLEDQMTKAIDEQFMSILERHEENLLALHPGKTLEEVKEELLRNLEDISALTSYLLPQGRNMTGESDLLAQMMRLEYELQIQMHEPKGLRVIQKMNDLLPKAVQRLQELGYVTRIFVGTNWNAIVNYQAAFFRKDAQGNPLPRLLSKFSQAWEDFVDGFNKKLSNDLYTASSSGNWAEVTRLLKEKYYTLSENVEFVDFRYLHDIYDSHPQHNNYKKGTDQEAKKYKEDLIAKIGEKEYEDILRRQINFLDLIPQRRQYLIDKALDAHKVFKYDDLPDKVKQDIDISMARRDPALFLESHLSGQLGEIPFTIGSQTYTKPSYIEFNAYIPRRTNSAGKDNGYFDSEYDRIENDPILRDFLKVLDEGIVEVNEDFADSDLGTGKRSILHTKKSFHESIFEKGWMGLIKGIFNKKNLSNVGHFLRSTASNKAMVPKEEKDVQLPQGIMSFENMISQEAHLLMLDVSNILGTNITSKSLIKWNQISLPNKQKIYEAVGVNTEAEFLQYAKPNAQGLIKVSDFRNFARMIVMDSQTFDLPTMLKAQIEKAMQHKARTIAKQNIDVLLLKSKEVLDRHGKRGENDTVEDTTSKKWNKERTNANKRNEFFYNTIVLNEKSSEEWGSVSNLMKKYFEKKGISPEDYINVLNMVYYKNFSPDEKRQFKILVKRLENIKTQLNNPSINQNLESQLLEEVDSINSRLVLMGEDYTASALYATVINKMAVRGVALGWSLVSPFYNMLNAKTSMFHRDGVFWTKGNIYAASTFVDMNTLRFIKPSYNKAWKTMGAFVHQMNLIQDGTNELQRAERTSNSNAPSLNPLKLITSPFHGTALVEYYNQLPSILAMAMDKTITHPVTGEAVPLFNGVDFPAHTTDANGLLKLKDEFKYDANGDVIQENIDNFENFDSISSALWKKQIHGAIASLNGDYSETGAIRAKQSEGGKTLIAFKTWMGEYYLARYAYNQKNLSTGKIEEGYVTGSFADDSTRGAAAGILIANAALAYFMLPAISFITGVGLFAAVLGIGGGAWGMIKALHKRKIAKKGNYQIPVSGSMFATVETLFYVIKASTLGLVEMPINYIYRLGALGLGIGTGKNNAKNKLINLDDTLGGRLNERQSKNLRGLTRQFQMSAMWTAVSVIAQALYGDGDDEEEEKQGREGTTKGERWAEQRERIQSNKKIYNFLKNSSSRNFDELMLGMSVQGTIAPFIGSQTVPDNMVERLGSLGVEALLEDNIYGKKGSMYYGDSKKSVMARKALMPSPIKATGKSQWALGFEGVLEEEFNKNTPLHKLFDTDLKTDIENNKRDRVNLKIRLEEEKASELYDKPYEELEPFELRKVDRKVKKEMSKGEYKVKRKDYDEDQNRNSSQAPERFF